jgi:hypothetical protein
LMRGERAHAPRNSRGGCERSGLTVGPNRIR